MYLYPDQIGLKLEFDQLRQLLAEHCVSELARGHALQLMPTAHTDVLKEALQASAEAYQLQAFDGGMPDAPIPHISAFLRTAFIEGAYLDEEQCFELLRLLGYVKRLIGFFDSRKALYPLLHSYCTAYELPKAAILALDQVIGPEGRMRSNASKSLADLSIQLNRLQADTRRRLDSIYRQAKGAGWVADTGITIRDGRLVIPVLAEHKRKIKGFVHDESNTGQTVYIEPAEVLELNNDIRNTELAQKREIRRILLQLTEQIRPYLAEIGAAHQLAARFDLLRAKALLALRFPYAVRPEIDIEITTMREAIHPLLYLHHKAQRKQVVPLNLQLLPNSRILVISGPNAGGKSVTLKTIGLLQLMFQSGLLVPLKEGSCMRVYRKLLVDLGDEQSIENDLSTYSSHLTNMRCFTEQADEHSLFLIDEFGTGTDPHLGGPIAEAILERLCKRGAYGVVNTHYSNLKLLASRLSGLINGSMGFDTNTLEARFTLEMGKPGSSFAFEIAEKIGLDREIIALAREKIGLKQQDVEQLLVQLEQEKQEMTRLKQLIEAKDNLLSELVARTEERELELKRRKKQLLEQAKEEAEALLKKANREIENTIRQIREQGADKAVTKQLREGMEALRAEIENKTQTEALPLKKADKSSLVMKPGVQVRLKGSETVGEILEINKQEVSLAVGGIRMQVKANRLEVVSGAEARRQQRKSSTQAAFSAYTSDFSPHIDVRGFRADEAIIEIDRRLDKALLSGYPQLQILHGKGDGILRKRIREHLKKQQFVADFESAHPDQGGDGITLVQLR